MKNTKPSDNVIVIGAGMGGLAAAIRLASKGVPVTLLERSAEAGGKMRQLDVEGALVDAGPTVLTMRKVFEQVFDEAGSSLEDHVQLHPIDRLARHAWDGEGHLDLFADPERSLEAVRAFSGADQKRLFSKFIKDGQRLYDVLENTFLTAPRPNVMSLTARILRQNPLGMTALKPFTSLWDALGAYFPDPRLRQLYGRYATYCGSSPFEAPATLMTVAALEQQGVWRVEGGMGKLAQTLSQLASSLGVQFQYETQAEEILMDQGRVSGVRTTKGDTINAGVVLANTDPDALKVGLLGEDAARAISSPTGPRGLSALVWTATGTASGFELDHHNVFFNQDYRAEFQACFQNGEIPDQPTVYICAQDRGHGTTPTGLERFLILINAPANGDQHTYTSQETNAWLARTLDNLAHFGLRLSINASRVTAPDQFARLFPGTGGALYGRALHGWQAAFQRPGARTQVPGLYLAGGGCHPGPGVPTSMLSGRIAAQAIWNDFNSTRRSHPGAIVGFTPTPSAKTDASASS